MYIVSSSYSDMWPSELVSTVHKVGYGGAGRVSFFDPGLLQRLVIIAQLNLLRAVDNVPLYIRRRPKERNIRRAETLPYQWVNLNLLNLESGVR